jgi:TIR domain
MAHDVFISYSSKDKAVADAVCAGLEGRGIACWIAPRDIVAGVDWGAAIVDAISASKVMVLIYSGNANSSHQIKREVERAVAKGVRLVPFRIEDVPLSRNLEYFISMAHWLDALTQPIDPHVARLTETVALLVKTRDSSQVPPKPFAPAVVRPAAPRHEIPPLVPPYRATRGVVVVGLAAVALAVLSFFVMRKNPPQIVAVSFPAAINAGSRDVVGTVQFEKGRGEIAQAEFTVVQAQNFHPFTVVPRGVAGQKRGSFSFALHSSIPQQVILKATLIDTEGRRSTPVSFSFDAKKAERPFEFHAPLGLNFKLPH